MPSHDLTSILTSMTDMGGENAAVEPVDSAAGMANVLLNLTAEQTGKFYDFEGKELPW